MKTKYTATLPDGETTSRTSETRTYTHVVVTPYTAEEKLEQARQALEAARERPALESYTATLVGLLEARIAELEQMPADAVAFWAVIGWCGRADLASKMVGRERARRPGTIALEATPA